MIILQTHSKSSWFPFNWPHVIKVHMSLAKLHYSNGFKLNVL